MAIDRRDPVTVGLVAFGVYLVGIALFGVVAPSAFFEELGRFGPRNDHYIHDVAAFQGATGLVLLLAIPRPTWRVPALAVASLQFGLHAISHLVDLSDADPRSIGVLEVVALTAATGVLLWLVALARRRESQ